MTEYSPAELAMWTERSRELLAPATDFDISEKYDGGEKRIITESNREKLPNFVDSLSRPGYLDLRPFYQRRARWDAARQSRLIESFIINIPVPPLFLYEKSYNAYEVMDGQQRISAIQAFYTNQLRLTGLEEWPELNGRTYATLPTKIRAGIDRRSISYVVLLRESTATDEEALLVKQMVFERLNTGGVKLGKQEIRNALYQGPLNTMLLRLSRNEHLARAWDIPEPEPGEEEQTPAALARNRLYMQMQDVELVLRFFALRHVSHFSGGVQGFLDLYMVRARDFAAPDLEHLSRLFDETIGLGADLYGELLFRPYDPQSEKWQPRAQKAFFDAVMVGLANNLSHADRLREKRHEVLEATKRLFIVHPPGTFTGSRNTKTDIEDRISLFSEMLSSVTKG